MTKTKKIKGNIHRFDDKMSKKQISVYHMFSHPPTYSEILKRFIIV